MRKSFVSLAAFAAVLAGLLVFTAPRARATGNAVENGAQLGRLFSVQFTDAQNGFALGDLIADQPRINVVKTSDGGTTWQLLWTFVRESDLDAIWMTSDRAGVISGSGKFFRTTNGGRSWTRVRTPYEMSKMGFVGGDGFAIGMPPVKRGTEGPTVLRSTNGGASWTPIVDQPATVADYCFSTAERGWVADEAGLSQTIDGGAHWTQKKPATGLTAVACFGDRYAWGVAVGKVYQTFDNGTNWFEHELGTHADITNLSFVDGSNGWAYGEREFRRTLDGGIHWQVLNAPPGAPHFSDADHGWCLSANGDISRTSDGGRTWVQQPRATNARTDTAVDISADGAEAIPQ
jgi:photosystem II stability/assembly factor-like uncharacterized protein